MSEPEASADRAADRARALMRAIASLGIEGALESRAGLALLVPSPRGATALRDHELRAAVVSLARDHGFTHIAVELPSDGRTPSAPDPDAPVLRD